ncbi:MAG: CHAT domain-containing protein [Acidobacteria bacterium]|nr:CHAT domain-containing protein [Acidobacteriota bacterium]
MSDESPARLDDSFGPLALGLQEEIVGSVGLDYDSNLEVLMKVLEEGRAARYPFVLASTLLRVGLIKALKGEPDQAIGYYLGAIDASIRANDIELTQHVRQQLAYTYQQVEDPRRAWDQIHLALQGSLSNPSIASRQSLYLATASIAGENNDSALAVVFADAALELTERMNDRWTLIRNLAKRSILHSNFGNEKAAKEDARRARGLVDFSDDVEPTLLAPDIYVTEALTLIETNPILARELLDQAEEQFRHSQNTLMTLETRLVRSRTYSTHHHWSRAEAEAEGALGEANELLRAPEVRLPIQLQHRRSKILAQLIRVRLASGCGADRTLEAVDAALRVSLNQALAPMDEMEPFFLDAQELAASLPMGSHSLVYWADDNELCIWSVRPDQIALRRVPTPRRELEEQANALTEAILGHRSGEASIAPAERLFRTMIEPVADLITEGETLIVIPAPSLNQIPFGTLRNPSSGKILLEEHAVSVVPSLSILRKLQNRPPYKEPQEPLGQDRSPPTMIDSRAPISVKVFAASNSDLRADNLRSRLVATEKEVDAVISTLGGLGQVVSVVQGEGVTRSAVLDAIEASDTFYFIGHAEARTSYDPRLFLAGSSWLTPRDLLASRDTGERTSIASFPSLVVLSACSTAAPNWDLSFPNVLLAMGTSNVVTNLWAVQDESTAELMAAFLRFLAEGWSPAEALRHAQLAARDAGAPARVWAVGRVSGSGG